MKNKSTFLSFLMILIIFVCSIPASADSKDIIIAVKGETGLAVETLDGTKAEFNPVTKEGISDITNAEIHTEDGKTIASLPSDQVYMIWLNAEEGEVPTAYNTIVTGNNWKTEFVQLFPAVDSPTLVVNPPSRFITEDGLLFEKLTIIAQPDAFPAMKINTDTPAGECTLSIDPAFSIFTAEESVLESHAEMVLTLFPDLDIVSLWISALDHIQDYPGSRFIMNTRLSCSDGAETVTAISVQDNMPVLNENGIINFNINEFLKGYDSFFSGDLNGDDDYETTSGENYFTFEKLLTEEN